MRNLLILPVALATIAGATAGTSVTPAAIDLIWAGSLPVPDNDATGASRTVTFNAPSLTEVSAVSVLLSFDGGWNGDLYAYLVHDGRIAVLLNRPGRTISNDAGAGSTSLVGLFMDTAADDVHTALADSGAVTGTWQPDGRDIDPLLSVETTPRTKLLGGFIGTNPNGDWTLFIADQGAGETATLTGVTVSIIAVPEPSAALLGLLSGAALLRRRRA